MLKAVLQPAGGDERPNDQNQTDGAGALALNPRAVEMIDYRFRQLIASNLAQAAIIATERALGPAEIVDLYARIFVELYSSSEVARAK